MGAKNAARVLESYGRDDILMFKGEETPREVPLVTAQDTHGEDGLGETFLSEPKLGFRDGGVDFILRSLYEHAGLTHIAIEPLTNVAAALERDRQAFASLGRLIVMVGLDVTRRAVLTPNGGGLGAGSGHHAVVLR